MGATAGPPAFTHCRWSAGVVMYTLLAGSPPFWHRRQMLMLRMIMSGDYRFGSPEWDDYSDTVKDLVRGKPSWLGGQARGTYSGERGVYRACHGLEALPGGTSP